VRADQEAYAKAIRAGKGDPGTPSKARHAHLVADLEHETEALKLAIVAIEADVRRLIENRRPAWRTTTIEADREDQAAELEAIAQLEATQRRRSARAGAVAWLDRFPERPVYTQLGSGRVPLTSVAGDSHLLTTVLDALRQRATRLVG
jgi:hypothetical protein